MKEIVIQQAQFVTSALRQSGWPEAGPAEVAFAGRSNVGKSSLINRLVNRKKLVRASSRPGCTQHINFFSFNNDAFRFVDLPGYGFARVPLAVKATWGKMIEEYLLQRQSLRGVVVILDIRRDLSCDDLNLLNWLQAGPTPWLAVLTKTDKFSRNQMQKALASMKKQLAPFQQTPLTFSALNGHGVPELWRALAPWLALPVEPQPPIPGGETAVPDKTL